MLLLHHCPPLAGLAWLPLLGVLLSCGTEPGPTNWEGRQPGECADQQDNDGDGSIDCDDEDCSGAPDCAGGGPPAGLDPAEIVVVPGNPGFSFDPSAPAFVDRTEELGLSYQHSIDNLAELSLVAGGADQDKLWTGFAISDLDGDGHFDIVFTERDQPLRVFFGGEGLVFTPRDPAELGLLEPAMHLSGVSAADIDGDGDNDLIVVGQDTRLYYNEGDGTFVDRTDLIGVAGPFQLEATASLVDADRDGDLDIYIANHLDVEINDEPMQGRDRFLVQQEDGSFVNRIDDLLPVELDREGWLAGWFDADQDGWLEMYVVHSIEPEDAVGNIFVRNRGTEPGSLEFEPDLDAGLRFSHRGMGLALGDMDGDGDIDVHVTDVGPTELAENLGEEGFVDVSGASGVQDGVEEWEFSWASIFFDQNNDGQLELFSAFGVDAASPSDQSFGQNGESIEQPDRLWYREQGLWSDHAVDVGLGELDSTRAALAVDLDRDGCLDLLTNHLLSGPLLYQGNCGEGSWVIVELSDSTVPNHAAVGARIEAWAGEKFLGVRELRIGSTGAFSSAPPEAHFGLGSHEEISLLVTWPDGAVTRNDGVAARSVVTLSR